MPQRYKRKTINTIIKNYTQIGYLQETGEKLFSGKNCVVIGDSISDSTLIRQATVRYFNLLNQNDGLTIIEDGKSGTGYVRNYAAYNNIVQRIYYSNWGSPDYITIFAGTNDWFGNNGEGVIDLGEYGDVYQDQTFYGYLDQAYTLLSEKYPLAKVVIALPIHRAWETSPNQRGNTLEEFVEAIRKVAHTYSLTVVDLYNDGGINPLIPNSRVTYFTTLDGLDGTHPNNLGHERLYHKFKEALKRA